MTQWVQPDFGAEIAPSYSMKVCATVLTMGLVQGVNPEDMVEFFATQVSTMLLSPPNYNKYGIKAPVWIMRGFYPGTSVFFKLIVARNDQGTWVRVSYPKINGTKNRPHTFHFDGARLNEAITDKMENTFFGAKHEVKPLISAKLRSPKCMSPKGVKIFNYEKPKKRTNK